MLSSTFIANAKFSVLWNGRAFIINRIVYVSPPKKKIPVICHYTLCIIVQRNEKEEKQFK